MRWLRGVIAVGATLAAAATGEAEAGNAWPETCASNALAPPVISLAPLREGDLSNHMVEPEQSGSLARRDVVNAIGVACRQWGFFQVRSDDCSSFNEISHT